MDVESAEKGLGAVAKFFAWLRKGDDEACDNRMAAVTAVFLAASKTRQYTKLPKPPTPANRERWQQEISTLWQDASRKIGRFNSRLGQECMIKAYGWGTGVWDDPAFEVVPRRVEKVYAEALVLISEYASILKRDALHAAVDPKKAAPKRAQDTDGPASQH